MSRTNRNLLAPSTPQLLRRTMTCLIVAMMVITWAILTPPVEALALQTNPSALSFTGTEGAADPSAQSVTIWKRNDRDKSWTATVSASWLTVSPPAGTISTERDQISVEVNLSNLAAGNYSSNVIIVEVGPTSGTRRTVLPVSLTVLPSNSTSSFSVSPPSLTFSGTAGGTSPAAKTFTVSNTGTGTLSWAASDNTPWLTLSPASGTNSGTVTATVNLTGLGAGTYSTAIAVTASGASTKTVPVTLTVGPGGSAGGFTLSPSSMSYTGTVGGPNMTAGVTITNSGSTNLTVSWRDDIDWLVDTSGDTVTMPPGGSAQIIHTASASKLSAGTYTDTATISGGGVTKQVPITMTLATSNTTPAIGLSPTSLTFTAAVGGTNPAAKPIAISNSGTGTLTWAASDNTAWLTLSPASGTNNGTVNASVNLTGLAAGSYNTAITVTAPGTTTKTVPVALTVTAPATPAIGLSPTSLTFTAAVGGTNPAAKPIAISNSGTGTLTWTASDNAAWLALSPASGTNSGTVTASVNMTGLAAGTYNGIITVTASGSTNSPRQIPVSFTLSTTTAGTATLAWNASTESDLTGYKVYRGTGSGTYGAPLATLPKTTTSYAATGLQNGTTYFFVITAYDSSDNESTYSNEVSKSIF